jgi:PAS domain S-box-containing protein
VLGIAQGLLTREQLETELRESEARFRTFMNQSPFVAFIKDSDGRFLFYNDRLAERFGISTTEWLGKKDCEIWPSEISREMRKNDLEVLGSDIAIERLEETKDAEGKRTTWKVHKFSWKNEMEERLIGGLGFDMTLQLAHEQALAEATLKLEKLAAIDSLTGLANRRILDERVEYEFRGARRNHSALSVVLLDIDNFKLRNDQFGHAGGDKILRRLGRLVLDKLRMTDMAGRPAQESTPNACVPRCRRRCGKVGA